MGHSSHNCPFALLSIYLYFIYFFLISFGGRGRGDGARHGL